VDGGWTSLGDWLLPNNTKFPGGMRFLSSKIHALGFKSGIWMAPFLVEPKSVFYEKKKNLLVKQNGVYVDGFRVFPLSGIALPRYILDIRKSEAMKTVKKNIDFLLKDCKFDLIKLDFLYSLYFVPGISEKEAGFYIKQIFTYIRERYPKVYTIACGIPLSAAIGVSDSVRIGPDIIDPNTAESFIGNVINIYKLKRVLNNIKDRMWTKSFWNIDPDVFVCRKSLGFKDFQLLALQKTIKEAKGNIFLGDDMTTLPKSRIEKFIKPLFD
jgi:alpha-galactosidase